MTIQRNGQHRVHKGAIKNDNPEKGATPGTQGAIKNDNPEKRATPGTQGGNQERQSRETGNTGYTRGQ